MRTHKADFDMTPHFDSAEALLVESGLHAVMARAILDYARYGAKHGPCSANHGEAHTSHEPIELLTTRQAAMRLGVSDKQVYRLVMQGRLRNHMLGRQYRFATRDLDALVAESGTGARYVHARRLLHEHRDAA